MRLNRLGISKKPGSRQTKMNIKEYLNHKYQSTKAWTITWSEAKIFGIPTPLEHGWIKRHGATEITDEMHARLAEALNRRISSKKKDATKAFAAKALEVVKVKQRQPKPQKVFISGYRVDLNCPYTDRNKAKRLGAQWDAEKKTWYIQGIEDLTPFLKWVGMSLDGVHHE